MARQLGIVYRKGGHVSWPIRRMSLADANATISKGGTLAINKANGHAEVWDKEGRCIGYLNRSGRGGSGGLYHFEGHDCASACGMARLLDLDHPKAPESVSEILRCRANGCRQRWDTASTSDA